jgi:hypothetical protein
LSARRFGKEREETRYAAVSGETMMKRPTYILDLATFPT